MTGIAVRNVTFAYGPDTLPVLRNVSFEVPQGSFFSILGPSGCGKTTLLRLLAGLARPDSGTVETGGGPVNGPGRDRAVVFQHGGLFPWQTALGNVAFAVSKTRPELGRTRCREAAREMLEQVGLGEALHLRPSQLSGGMRQRVAIARALATGADILLLDEPFSALDYRNRCRLQDLVAELWLKHRKTVVFITHDIDEALLLSDVILFMGGNGYCPRVAVPFPRPRTRELLTGAECCTLRKRFIALFNGTDALGGLCR